jgi:CDGSH-type Zn-finger protein/uncharacterized Fe-S cluster protein YjdI
MSESRKHIYTYQGEQVDVHWDERLCIHIGECGRAEGELFIGGRKPWCQPDLVPVAEVVDVCNRCPTGALTFTRKDGGPGESADETNTVVVSTNGPYYVRGNLRVDGATDDMEGVNLRAALCRCGASKNKPFCDNTHQESGFSDSGAVGMKGEDTGSGGELEIKKAPNGPLLLSGNFALITSSGRVAFKGNKAALCRCGASKNKPFCDGAHKQAGFQAE